MLQQVCLVNKHVTKQDMLLFGDSTVNRYSIFLLTESTTEFK